MSNPFDVEFNQIEDFANMLNGSDSDDAVPQSMCADQIQNHEFANSLGSPSLFATSQPSSQSKFHWSQVKRSEIGVMTAAETARFAASLGSSNIPYHRSSGGTSRIINIDGTSHEDSFEFAAPFNAIGPIMLFDRDLPSSDWYHSSCTGTLIAPNVVLSGSFCGYELFDSSDYPVDARFQIGTDFEAPVFVSSIQEEINLREIDEVFLGGNDVSLLILSDPVPSSVATPMRLTDLTHELVGMTAAMIGTGAYGDVPEGDYADGFGLRSGGTNVIDSYGKPVLENGANIFSADFDNGSQQANTIPGSSATPLELESTFLFGDAGGPIMVQLDDEWVIAGVASEGSGWEGLEDRFYGEVLWWTGTGIHRELIEGYGGEFADGSSLVGDDHSGSRSNASTKVDFAGQTNIGSHPIGREEGSVETAGDVDVFRFNILRESRLIVDAVAEGNFDPLLKLYSSNGTMLRENDNKANSLSSQIILRVEPGTYYAEVHSNDPGEMGSYRFATRHNATPDDVGGRFALAGTVVLADVGNTNLRGTTEIGNDRDTWRFLADRTGDLVIRTSAKSGDLNTVLRVFDSNNDLIASNNNWNRSLDSRVRLSIQEGNLYYVSVDSVKQTTGDYRLSLIPKANDRGQQRSANVDLNLPSRLGSEGGLSMNGIGSEMSLRSASPVEMLVLRKFGPQPLGLLGSSAS